MPPFAPSIPVWLMTLDQPWSGDKNLTDIPVRSDLISLAWPRFGPGWSLSSNNDPIERQERVSWWRKKWRDHCSKVDVSFKVSASEVCYMARQNDSCFPMYNTKLYTVKYIIGQGGSGGKQSVVLVKAELLQSLYNTWLLIAPGLCSQYGHASCECLYWKISCLSTWQTPSSLSEREPKINSLMASQSVRTSMQHKQAHTGSHEYYRLIHF